MTTLKKVMTDSALRPMDPRTVPKVRQKKMIPSVLVPPLVMKMKRMKRMRMMMRMRMMVSMMVMVSMMMMPMILHEDYDDV